MEPLKDEEGYRPQGTSKGDPPKAWDESHVVDRVSTKHNDPCLKKAADDEPIFVLRAQDMTAPIIVMFWILIVMIFSLVEWIHWDKNKITKETTDNTLRSAFEQALRMRRWSKRKLPE